MDVTNHVVNLTPANRKTRILALYNDIQDLLAALLQIQRDNPGAWNHNLCHSQRSEL